MKYEEEFRLLLGEPEELKYRQLEWLYDIKQAVCVRKMQIDWNLQVGHVYDLSFERIADEDSNTYSFLVIKKEEPNIYYLAEFYNGHYYKVSEKYLGECWKKCDLADYGIDLDSCLNTDTFTGTKDTVDTQDCQKCEYCCYCCKYKCNSIICSGCSNPDNEFIRSKHIKFCPINGFRIENDKIEAKSTNIFTS